MGIIRYILKNAERFPDKAAVVLDQEMLTYSQCVERTRKVSGALSELGIGDGTHVGLLASNSLEFVISMLAIADLGATVVPMYTTISNKALVAAIHSTDISYIISRKASLERALDAPQQEQDIFPISRDRCIVLACKFPMNWCWPGP